MTDAAFNAWAIGKARDLLRELLGYDDDCGDERDENMIVDALKQARRQDG